MEKVKNVSKVITYDEIPKKYFNSYFPIKNEKQRNKNNKNKEELEKLLNYFCEKEPLFSRFEIFYKPVIIYFNMDGKIIKEQILHNEQENSLINKKLNQNEKDNNDKKSDDCLIF